jgi:chromosome partitioning protein
VSSSFIANPAAFFDFAHKNGSDTLNKLRKSVTAPSHEKTAPVWGINDAGKMIGRSPERIRQAEATDPRFSAEPAGPVPMNSSGHRVYSLERINYYRDLFGTRLRRPPGSKAVRLAVANFKGGAAKTTTAIHLAQFCALQGLRVLMVDLDPQATSTLLFGVPANGEVEALPDTISDVLLENPNEITSVILKTYFHGLDLVPGNLTLQDADLMLNNPFRNNQDALGAGVGRLSSALDVVEDDYDVMIFDSGPNTGPLTLNAIYAANGLLIPMQPQMPDFGSAILFAQSMHAMFKSPKMGHSLEFVRVAITRHTNTQDATMIARAIVNTFGPTQVLANSMVQTVELERKGTELGTIYDIKTLRGSRDAYKRALEAADAMNLEMLTLFQDVWARQVLRSI